MVSTATAIQPACTLHISWREILPSAHSWTKSLPYLWLQSDSAAVSSFCRLQQPCGTCFPPTRDPATSCKLGRAQLRPLLTTLLLPRTSLRSSLQDSSPCVLPHLCSYTVPSVTLPWIVKFVPKGSKCASSSVRIQAGPGPAGFLPGAPPLRS